MRGLPVHRRVEALVERRPLRRSDLNRDEALGFVKRSRGPHGSRSASGTAGPEAEVGDEIGELTKGST